MQTKMRVIKTTGIDIPDLNSRIEDAIKKDSRSVQVIATEAGLSGAYIYNLMKNKPSSVDLEIIRKLESVLKVDFGIEFCDVA